MKRISRIEIINAYNKAAERLINETDFSNATKTTIVLFAASLGTQVATDVIDKNEFDTNIEPENFFKTTSEIGAQLIKTLGDNMFLVMHGALICAYAHKILFPKGVVR